MAKYIHKQAAIHALVNEANIHNNPIKRAYTRAAAIIEQITAEDVQPVKQWISVEDRLPDNDGWYLVYKFKQVRVAEWCESCWYNERDLPIDDVAISHWMSLPEPPYKT